MPFPLKFKTRLELSKEEVDTPSEAWITYAVCGCEPEACGWEGWILEAVASGIEKKQLRIDDSQRCPSCGKPLFRTEATYRFSVSDDQSPNLKEDEDYEKMAQKYE